MRDYVLFVGVLLASIGGGMIAPTFSEAIKTPSTVVIDKTDTSRDLICGPLVPGFVLCRPYDYTAHLFGVTIDPNGAPKLVPQNHPLPLGTVIATQAK